MHPWGVEAAAIAMAAGVFVLLGWPRGRFTHRYELFVAAPPQTVWETYFVHVKKADYRPGTRVLDAEILGENPLTVRLKLQFNYQSEPSEITLVYDLWEPFTRYRLRGRGGFAEAGEFVAEPGGTRLKVAVTGRARGFVLPAIARRRVERNQRALKDVCEGRQPEAPRAALPRPPRWLLWLVLLALAAPWLSLPWQLQLPLLAAGLVAGVLYIWRFVALLARL